MHVVYIHQHFSTLADNTGTRSYEMAKRLLREGHRVTMIAGAFSGAAERLGLTAEIEERDIDGIRVIYINEPYENRLSFWQRVRVFGRFARKALDVIKRQPGVDLVFATSTPLTVGEPGRKGAAALGVPFVFEVRDLWPELPIAMGIIRNPLLKWYLRRMERRIYAAAAHIIALSPGMKEGIAATGYPLDRITMIPNAADLDLFRPRFLTEPHRSEPRPSWSGDLTNAKASTIERRPLPDGRGSDQSVAPVIGNPAACRFIFSGAHGMANGLDALIDAAAELKRRGERDIQFICIGDGKLKPDLVARTKQLALDDYLLWHDPIPKAALARVLPTFDVGLMLLANIPAFYRGTSPNKFFDYISAGLPVLNNYPGWLAGMIRDNNFGRVTSPGDAGEFADAVIWLRDHPAERAEMGRRARTFAEANFSRESMSELFVRTLERVAR